MMHNFGKTMLALKMHDDFQKKGVWLIIEGEQWFSILLHTTEIVISTGWTTQQSKKKNGIRPIPCSRNQFIPVSKHSSTVLWFENGVCMNTCNNVIVDRHHSSRGTTTTSGCSLHQDSPSCCWLQHQIIVRARHAAHCNPNFTASWIHYS